MLLIILEVIIDRIYNGDTDMWLQRASVKKYLDTLYNGINGLIKIKEIIGYNLIYLLIRQI